MSAHNKVVWSEGLFLQPQHFQQQDRYIERFVEGRCQALVPFGWGLSELEFERDLLSIGKLAVRSAAGVFPDGTPFRLPDDDILPAPLDIGSDVRDQVVFLGVPVRRADSPDFDRAPLSDGLARHNVRQREVRDTTSTSGNPALLDVAPLSTRLLLASELTDAYACIPIAHVVERRADQQVLLEEKFIPTVLRARAASRLASFTTELVGLLHQRGEMLARVVTGTAQGGTAEIAQFLMLEAVNRYEPLLAHYADAGTLHPEELFRIFVSAAGELATFATTAKRPPSFAGYRHERLRETFEPVMEALRKFLSMEQAQRAIQIPLEQRKFGISVAIVNDTSLYQSAAFVLAARADVAAEELRKRFPAQLKVGPVEKISDLVNFALPGVPVNAVPVAPRQIPFHKGFAYFELDQSHELWKQLSASGGLAIHIAGDFPGLAMEMWAIRE